MKTRKASIQLLALLTFAAFSTEIFAEESWNQWRGPQRNGAAAAGAEWPDSLGKDRLTKVWEIDLDPGYSSPISSDGHVFTVETRNKESEVVRAFEIATGNPVWDSSWTGAMEVPFFAAKNGSWARCTPAVADNAIYVGGIRDVLTKLDASTGEELWRIDFMEREGTELPAFGHVSSPLIDDGAIVIQAGCAVVKLNAETGETIWRALEDRRAMFGSAFSSVVIATVAGQRQVVAQTRSTLGGLDLETGEVLWSTPVEAFRGMNILTPTVIGENRIFTATYGGGSHLFEVTKDASGKFAVSEKWRVKTLEGYMASPIVIDGHLYLFGRDRKLHCVELASGNIAWSTSEKFGEYWSLTFQGDRVLALDQTGELILFRATPDAFTLLDRQKVSPKDPTWAHLGIEGDRLLIRSLKGLSIYQWR
ncbi:MAG: outer membrane protein assembly factor BamB [Verrucomicrobiales bacterium]|jgi:outer membrane protein assembly factor BamB